MYLPTVFSFIIHSITIFVYSLNYNKYKKYIFFFLHVTYTITIKHSNQHYHYCFTIVNHTEYYTSIRKYYDIKLLLNYLAKNNILLNLYIVIT